jgi:hypothetical protein
MWPFTKRTQRVKTMTTTFVERKEYDRKPVVVARWPDPPVMDTGAPEPALKRVGEQLFLAYVCHNPDFPGWDTEASADHPGFEIYSALIRFDKVSEHYVGPPNDESINLHPLYDRGLEPYGFWEVDQSPRALFPLHHWICTFHDQTVEVVAECATVVDPHVPGENTQRIVGSSA